MHLDCSIGRLALAGSTVFVISQIVVGEILAFVVLLLLRDLMSYPFGKWWFRGGPTTLVVGFTSLQSSDNQFDRGNKGGSGSIATRPHSLSRSSSGRPPAGRERITQHPREICLDTACDFVRWRPTLTTFIFRFCRGNFIFHI